MCSDPVSVFRFSLKWCRCEEEYWRVYARGGLECIAGKKIVWQNVFWVKKLFNLCYSLYFTTSKLIAAQRKEAFPSMETHGSLRKVHGGAWWFTKMASKIGFQK